ncbi:MAG: hypothetical protein H6706_28755 [Myxococcales bacterium]|nr:hypothetical protein [Myxococcales bacterium]
MSGFDKLVLLVVVAQGLYALFQRVSGRGNRREVTRALDQAPAIDDVERWRTITAIRLQDMATGVAELVPRMQRVDQGLTRAGASGRLLLGVLRDRLQPEQARCAAQLETLKRRLAELEATEAYVFFEQQADLGGLIERLGRLAGGLSALESQAEWRQDAALREVVGDAEAIAVALLAPIRQFAGAHGLRLPVGRPICAPGTGQESVWYDLLPGHPVIRVPDDFGEDLLRWPSVAHEVGHLLWWGLPGLAVEIRGLVPTAERPWLPHVQGRRATFDLEAAFAHWLPELVADAFAAMMMGPAALRGLAHSLARPDDPGAVVRLHAAPDGQTLAAHAPPHLRVALSAWLVERMGFLKEPEAVRRAWDATHGAPDALWCPTRDGDRVPLPFVRFRIYGQQLLERFYTDEYQSFAGYPLSAVTGLEMSPGLWARVQRRAQDLLSGEPFNDDPRVVITAAIEAAVAAPGQELRVSQGVRRAVLGIGLDEDPVDDVHYARRAGGGRRLTSADIRDAIVLDAILGARRAHPGRR